MRTGMIAQICAASVLAFAWSACVRADAGPAAMAAFTAGDYDVVVSETAENADADGLALAAKARNAQAIFSEAGPYRTQLIAEARRFAEAALESEPEHVEALLQLSIVTWLEGRELGPWEAYSRGLVGLGRELIEAAIEQSPDEPWAHALLGAWNLEVARRGGRSAMMMTGARISRGERAFAHALELDPQDAAISTQCAISYLSLNAERYADEAAACLELALAAPVEDAFEAALQEQAREIATHLAAGEEAAAMALVMRFVEG